MMLCFQKVNTVPWNRSYYGSDKGFLCSSGWSRDFYFSVCFIWLLLIPSLSSFSFVSVFPTITTALWFTGSVYQLEMLQLYEVQLDNPRWMRLVHHLVNGRVLPREDEYGTLLLTKLQFTATHTRYEKCPVMWMLLDQDDCREGLREKQYSQSIRAWMSICGR